MHGIADVTFDFIEKLSEVTPDGMGYVKTYSGASEAMESAIKFSRQYHKQSGSPGKYKFLSRYQSYHGATMGAMSAGNGQMAAKDGSFHVVAVWFHCLHVSEMLDCARNWLTVHADFFLPDYEIEH